MEHIEVAEDTEVTEELSREDAKTENLQKKKQDSVDLKEDSGDTEDVGKIRHYYRCRNYK